LALFAWYCVVKVVPDCNVSIYRYRLWRVRDRLADQVRAGLYENESAPLELLHEIERFIANAHELGIVKLVLAKWAARGYDEEDLCVLDRTDLSPDDHHRLRLMFEEVNRITARHIALGAPSGWVITGLLIPVAVIASIVETFRRPQDHGSVLGHARDRVRHETTPPPGIFRPEDTGTHSLTRAY
jgi:hypothetical protein